MADDGIFTKNADIQAMAGANANTTAKAVAATDIYVLNVEAFINNYCHYNFSDKYTTLNVDFQGLLKECGACLCAMRVIQWDMSGFTSRAEAQTMLDFLWATSARDLKTLSDKVAQEFMGAI